MESKNPITHYTVSLISIKDFLFPKTTLEKAKIFKTGDFAFQFKLKHLYSVSWENVYIYIYVHSVELSSE